METRLLPINEIRHATAADGAATFDGVAVPYGQTIRVGGISETFSRGAVDPDTVTGLPILWQHNSAQIAGVIREAHNTDGGLQITGELIDTLIGRDATAALRAGAVRGLSIGFEPGEETWDGTHVTRQSIRLRELSIATFPAYETAQVLTVRQEETPMTAAPEVAPDYATRDDLAALEARMHTSSMPARTLGVVEAFVHQLEDSAKGRQLRALADVIKTGNAGILPPAWSSEVRNYVDRLRYMIPQAGSIQFPSTGYTLTVPKVLTHTLVAARGNEKSEIPSRALTTGQDIYTATWYAGGVDVALELIWQSDPSVWNLVVADLLQQYAEVTDTAFTLAVAAAGEATGAVLPFTDWKAFVTAVVTQAEAIRLATGQFGDRLCLTTASWKSLVGLTDTTGRRLLAPIGATNADGEATLLDRSVNIGGIIAFHNPRATEDVLFNGISARVAEKPPVTITQDVVALMGRDVGVLGAMMDVLLPAGIKTFSVTQLLSAKK